MRRRSTLADAYSQTGRLFLHEGMYRPRGQSNLMWTDPVLGMIVFEVV